MSHQLIGHLNVCSESEQGLCGFEAEVGGRDVERAPVLELLAGRVNVHTLENKSIDNDLTVSISG